MVTVIIIDIKLSFLSGENGKSYMGAVVQRMAKQINVNDVHIGLVDKHMHGKVREKGKYQRENMY